MPVRALGCSHLHPFEASRRCVAHRSAVHLRNQPWRRRERRLATTEASQLADSMGTASFVRVERQREGLEKLVLILQTEASDDQRDDEVGDGPVGRQLAAPEP